LASARSLQSDHADEAWITPILKFLPSVRSRTISIAWGAVFARRALAVAGRRAAVGPQAVVVTPSIRFARRTTGATWAAGTSAPHCGRTKRFALALPSRWRTQRRALPPEVAKFLQGLVELSLQPAQPLVKRISLNRSHCPGPERAARRAKPTASKAPAKAARPRRTAARSTIVVVALVAGPARRSVTRPTLAIRSACFVAFATFAAFLLTPVARRRAAIFWSAPAPLGRAAVRPAVAALFLLL
jgi:hypothetical protein